MPDSIDIASSAADYQAFGGLVREYVEWCRGRYRDDPAFVEQVFGYQSLEAELQSLSACYGAPRGRTCLARSDGAISGGGAWRALPDGSCEMKRLYVRDAFQGRGLGRALCATLLETARAAGFKRMRLDTATRLTEAIGLYRALGFRECPPYCSYPEALMPHIVFMEAPLWPAPDGGGR